MTDKPSLLCFSRDQDLLITRVAVLKSRYRVVPVNTLEEMQSLPHGLTFDLILLCHTLKEGDCEGSRKVIQERWPGAKLLTMTKLDTSCAGADDELAVRGLDGPAVLLKRLEALLNPPTRVPNTPTSIELAYL